MYRYLDVLYGLSLVFMLLFFVMALPNWGALQKAQDDPETIEEAIARLIAAHNEEPESHLGAGQSLEAHRQADVIDHPEGSIPTDKYSTAEFVIPFALSNADFWTTTNISETVSFRGYTVENTSSNTNDSHSDAFLSRFSALPSAYNFYILDFSLLFFKEDYSQPTIVGFQATSNSQEDVVFVFEDDEVRGRIITNGVNTDTNPLTLDIEDEETFFARCRIVYDIAADSVSFFVNGTLVGTLTPPSSFAPGNNFVIDLTRSAANSSANEVTLTGGFLSAGTY